MTINSVRTLVTSRQFPSPPADESSHSFPCIYGAPDFPFKGWQPPQTESYRQSTATSHEHAFVIDNGKLIDSNVRALLTPSFEAQAPLKLDSPWTKPLAL